MMKAYEASGWEADKISVSQPNYPMAESPSTINPPAARNGGRTISETEPTETELQWEGWFQDI